MDAKIGLVMGLVVGAILGAGGTFMAINGGPQPELLADAQDPIIVTKTQVVMIAAAERPTVETREVAPLPEGEQVIAFRPQDEGPGGTNGNRRSSWPEQGTAEWSNRVAQFRSEMSNRFERFRSEATNRMASDRTNFIATVKLNEDQAVRFDVLMTAMNVRLAAVLDPIVAEMQAGRFPRLTTEERARLAHELSGALVNTYDEMNRNMPTDWSSNASSNHVGRLTRFVQPEYQPIVERYLGGDRGGPGGWGDRGRGGDRGGPPGGGGQQPGGATSAVPTR